MATDWRHRLLTSLHREINAGRDLGHLLREVQANMNKPYTLRRLDPPDYTAAKARECGNVDTVAGLVMVYSARRSGEFYSFVGPASARQGVVDTSLEGARSQARAAWADVQDVEWVRVIRVDWHGGRRAPAYEAPQHEDPMQQRDGRQAICAERAGVEISIDRHLVGTRFDGTAGLVWSEWREPGDDPPKNVVGHTSGRRLYDRSYAVEPVGTAYKPASSRHDARPYRVIAYTPELWAKLTQLIEALSQLHKRIDELVSADDIRAALLDAGSGAMALPAPAASVG